MRSYKSTSRFLIGISKLLLDYQFECNLKRIFNFRRDSIPCEAFRLRHKQIVCKICWFNVSKICRSRPLSSMDNLVTATKDEWRRNNMWQLPFQKSSATKNWLGTLQKRNSYILWNESEVSFDLILVIAIAFCHYYFYKYAVDWISDDSANFVFL